MKSDSDNNDNNDGAVADNDDDFFVHNSVRCLKHQWRKGLFKHTSSLTLYSLSKHGGLSSSLCCHVRTGMSKCDLSATGNTDRFEIGLDN